MACFSGDVFELKGGGLGAKELPFRLKAENVRCIFSQRSADSNSFTIWDSEGSAVLGELIAPSPSAELHRASRSVLWVADKTLYSLMFRTNYEFELFDRTIGSLQRLLDIKMLKASIESDEAYAPTSTSRGTKRARVAITPKASTNVAGAAMSSLQGALLPKKKKATEPKRVLNTGIYNCHSCHYGREEGVHCPNQLMGHSWCNRCLATRFNANFEDMQAGRIHWQCPVCAFVCPCPKCGRERAKRQMTELPTKKQCALCLQLEPKAVEKDERFRPHPFVVKSADGAPLHVCEPCYGVVLGRRQAAYGTGEDASGLCALCAEGGDDLIRCGAGSSSTGNTGSTSNACVSAYCGACLDKLLTKEQLAKAKGGVRWECSNCSGMRCTISTTSSMTSSTTSSASSTPRAKDGWVVEGAASSSASNGPKKVCKKQPRSDKGASPRGEKQQSTKPVTSLPVPKFQCRLCFKGFKSDNALKYHTKNRVCVKSGAAVVKEQPEGAAAAAAAAVPPAVADRDICKYMAAYIRSTRKREESAGVWDPLTEDACFCCKDGGELIECDWNREESETEGRTRMCPKVYHEDCLGFKVPEDETIKWCCPRHYCMQCGLQNPPYACRYCPMSFCIDHKPGDAELVGPATPDVPGVTFVVCSRCSDMQQQASERGLLTGSGKKGISAVEDIFGAPQAEPPLQAQPHRAQATCAASALNGATVVAKRSSPSWSGVKNSSTNSPPSRGNGGVVREGRWDGEEHQLFEEGIKIFGKDWQRVAEHIETRTAAQCRTHFQKWENHGGNMTTVQVVTPRAGGVWRAGKGRGKGKCGKGGSGKGGGGSMPVSKGKGNGGKGKGNGGIKHASRPTPQKEPRKSFHSNSPRDSPRSKLPRSSLPQSNFARDSPRDSPCGKPRKKVAQGGTEEQAIAEALRHGRLQVPSFNK
jgi:hypothetical protein